MSPEPQSVSLVTHLVEDIDVIEQFRQANTNTLELTVPDARYAGSVLQTIWLGAPFFWPRTCPTI
jgi:hypothetical protein